MGGLTVWFNEELVSSSSANMYPPVSRALNDLPKQSSPNTSRVRLLAQRLISRGLLQLSFSEETLSSAGLDSPIILQKAWTRSRMKCSRLRRVLTENALASNRLRPIHFGGRITRTGGFVDHERD